MSALIALLERQLGLSWSDIVEWLREQNALDAIEARLIERGIGAGTVTSTTGILVQIETAAARYADDLHAAYVQSGQRVAQWLDDKLDDTLVRFDQTNVRAVARAQANRYELVQGLTEESREVVSRVVSDGLAAGTNPRVMAREIRDSIGLTPSQESAVRRYRKELESGDFSSAMGRELRDGRSDRRLRRLMRDGGELEPEQIDMMVERYRTNFVAYRAEVVARTEALRAAHEGVEEMYRQAIERGDLQIGQLVRTWNAGGGRRTRDSHAAMDGQERPFGQAFESGNGYALRYPGDPSAPRAETINCRCAVSTILSPSNQVG